MRLLRRDLENVTLIKASGTTYENVKVNLQSQVGKVLTTEFDVPFEEGDTFQRPLNNGIVENYELVQVNRSQNVINIDIKKIINKEVKRKTKKEELRELIELGKQAIKVD